MPLPKEKFHELVLQAIFSIEVTKEPIENLIPLLKEQLFVSQDDAEKGCELAVKILEKEKDLDEKIATHSSSYSINRIQRVERNILRIALYEILFDDSIPPKVSIAEALRLAKKFSTTSSAAFIHALLDAIWANERGEPKEESILLDQSEALKESEKLERDAALNTLPDSQTLKDLF